jgi:hypothetical protein
MPSTTTKPKASWQQLARQWLTKLEIDEVSLVDRGACPQAVVAFTKRDGSDSYQRVRQIDGTYLFERIRKQNGAGGVPCAQGSVPVYRESTDPQYKNLTRPKENEMSITTSSNNTGKKRKKRFKALAASIQKGGLPGGHQAEIWDTLIRKAASRAARGSTGGNLRLREELELARLLEQDFQSGGGIIGYLSSNDPANNGHVVAKAAPACPDTRAERILQARAERICKADPAVTYQQAYNRVLEADPALYDMYEVEKAEMAASIGQKRKRSAMDGMMTGTDDDADEEDDGEDEDDDDDDGRLADKRRKCSKCNRVAIVAKGVLNYCPACGSKLPK